MVESKTSKSAAKDTAKTARTPKATSDGAPQAAVRGIRKVREGTVVSDKMDKTVVVAVVRQVRHSTYGKFVRRTKKLYAHDEREQCGVGDVIRIVETRPLSKLKRWKVESIVRKAE